MRRLFTWFAVLSVSIFLNQSIFAQSKSLKSNIELKTIDQFQKFNSNQKQLDEQQVVYLQFENIPNQQQLNLLADKGIQLFNFESANTYLASVPSNLNLTESNQIGIIAFGEKSLQSKIAKSIFEKDIPEYAKVGTDKISIAINFYDGFSKDQYIHLLQSYGVVIVESNFKGGSIFTGEIDLNKVKDLANEAMVSFVDVVTPPVESLNNETRAVQSVNYVNSAIGKNLNGNGVVVGVGDGGELGDHLDFGSNVINYAQGTYASFGDHGDHVAGIIGSKGTLNPRHKGMATEATLLIQKTSLITYYMEDYFNNHGMVITNNSYGTSHNCTTNGAYNYTSQNLDWQLNEFPEVLHVFAAGNSGTQTCAPYLPGYFSVLRYYQSAKNVLTVGNVDANRVIKSNSSKGPVLDGRLKPEIVAVGTNVVSTGRIFNYKNKSGTSMASPAVAGTMALLYESYRNENGGSNPKGALMKAIACNTAEDLGNSGPDYVYGYGLINAKRAVETIEQDRFIEDDISDSEENVHTITIPANVKQMKVMLYWSDKENAPYPTKALVNDLDIKMTTPSGVEYLPWVLNADPTAVADLATRKIDTLNNIEQITFDNPTAGTYTITINGSEIPFGPQNYFVTYDYAYNDVIVTSPIGAECYLPNNPEMIQWDTDATNTSSFSVEYSLDGGSSWTMIDNNVAADARNIVWNVPNSFTESGLIKVSKNDGSTNDQNSTPFSILGQPIITASPACEGRVHMTWTALSNIVEYDVLMISNDQFVNLGSTSDLEFTVDLDTLQIGTQYWFSLVGKTTSGIATQRAVAQGCTPENNVLCPWSNDIYVQSIKVPVKRRKNTTGEFTQSEKISVEVINIGDNDLTSFDIAYKVNSGNTIIETFNGNLISGDTLVYEFNHTQDFSNVGIYAIDAWTNLAGDVHNNNDSLIDNHTSEQLANELIDLNVSPLKFHFDLVGDYVYDVPTMGLNELERCDFNNRNFGELKINGTTNEALELAIDETSTDTLPADYFNETIFTFNLADHNPQKGLAIDFQYALGDLFPLAGGAGRNAKVFARGNDQYPWVELYEMDDYEPGWHEVADINIIAALEGAVQPLSSSFQIKFQENGKGLYVDNLVLRQISSLPVELIKFTAEKVGVDAYLKWSTASEINNSHFEVQVAKTEFDIQNNDFQTIGRVEGMGTSSAINEYYFIDKTLEKSGMRYYRLKQVDLDGQFEYSDIRVLDYKTVFDAKVNVFPNPFIETINIQFDKAVTSEIACKIVDVTGRSIQEFRIEPSEGHIFEIEISNRIPSGNYYLWMYEKNNFKSIPLSKKY